jgi:hypothetical protein
MNLGADCPRQSAAMSGGHGDQVHFGINDAATKTWSMQTDSESICVLQPHPG